MFTTYRRALGLPGALAFSLTGLVARLPISMVSLGIVLLVSTRTGSYGLAGAVSAAYILAQAGFAVVQGRLTDRFGQSRVLPVGILVFTVSLSLMMTAVELDWPVPVPHLFAAVAGAALPGVGSSVRARWSHIAPDKATVQTAFAFEAVVDETVFMLGPTLVTVLATAVHPLAGLAAAIVAGLSGTLALAAQRRTEPPAHPRVPDRTARPRLPWPTLGPLLFAATALGALFGATEVATVALAEELGAKVASGPLLAVWALGSLVSGVVTGAIAWRVDIATRFRVGATFLAASILPLPFVRSLWVMGAVLFVAGFAISPTLIAMTAWIEQVVPTSRLNEGMSIIHTGIAAGIAPGAAVAGQVIDSAGASPSYWVPAVAGWLGVLAALAAQRSSRRSATSEAASPSGSSG